LVLFDVDGTLLWSNGVGRRAMEAALVAVFGSPGARTYHYDGKTDLQIVRELMRDDGHDDTHIDRRLAALTERYLTQLEHELSSPASTIELLPGVAALLEALQARSDCVVGLLTGNVAGGAARKLAAVGLDAARFRVCAYGSDHEVRDELPEIARRRASECLGLELGGDAVVIIGDTPADIACGRRIGARAIAVATGRFDVDQLAAHAPSAVFRDLTDTTAVLQAIFAR
jgi:phosphoglycolate phosphatase-like HAD superfamily hydrolase